MTRRTPGACRADLKRRVIRRARGGSGARAPSFTVACVETGRCARTMGVSDDHFGVQGKCKPHDTLGAGELAL